MSDPVQMLRALTGDAGFDDIFVMRRCLLSLRWLMNYWRKMAV
ncbi:oxidoreductase [Escherichia coli]|uniref:Oxidoreductase n=1 Tax=Escherichia coli TaxID=562 RepID=A0A376ZQX1_ECOLX|nr:oxidoreductase [Escherichia coli]